jgi:hypothetical protein
MVSGEPPEFITVSERLVVVPAGTFPKLRLEGVAVSWPGVSPVPDRDTLRVEFEAVDAMARLPLTLPAVVGEKITLKLTLWPALKVAGTLKPLVLNWGVAFAANIVMLLPLEFVRVSVSVWGLLSETPEKARLVGLAVSRPGAVPEVVPVPDTGKVTFPPKPNRSPRSLLKF